jgi:hypothetical protein
MVVSEIGTIMAEDELPFTQDERHGLIRDLKRDVMGLGPREQSLADPKVTEVM